MNNAEGVGCLGVECAEARDSSSQAKGGTVVGTSLHYVFWLSVLFCFVLFCFPCNSRCACGGMTTTETTCLCCLVSLKSRPNPGLLVLCILAGNGSLAPVQISPLFLFKKNTRGPTNAQHRMLCRHAATLTQLCPMLQSGRKCSSCVWHCLKGAILVDGHLASQTAILALPPSVTRATTPVQGVVYFEWAGAPPLSPTTVGWASPSWTSLPKAP